MNRSRILGLSICAIFLATAIVACSPGDQPAPKPTEVSAATQVTPEPVKVDSKVRVELFVMSQCPFGKGAEGVMMKVMNTLPGAIDFDLGWVINKTDGPEKFKSLHGPEEVALNKVQACVGIIHGDKQLPFITQANETTAPWQETAKAMNLDIDQIEACVKDGRADAELAADAEINKTRSINASPTFFINGQEYSGPVSSLDIFDTVCKALGPQRPSVCANPPEALSRSDGSSAGRCGDDEAAAQVDPSLVDDMKITHTVILPAGAFSDHSSKVLQQTKGLFPKAEIVQLPSTDAKAKKMIADYKLEWLPAFLFPKEVEHAKSFARMKGVMIPLGDGSAGYQLDPMKIASNYSLSRAATPGTVDIIYTPYSPRSLTMLLDIVDTLATPEFASAKDKVRLLPSPRIDPRGNLVAQRGEAELEEIARHAAILKNWPDKFRAYLEARRNNPGGTYWEEFCETAGLVPADVKAKARDAATIDALKANATLATELGIGVDIIFLVNNKELTQVLDRDEFRRLVKYAAASK